MHRVAQIVYFTLCIYFVQSTCPPQGIQRSWEAKLHADVVNNYSLYDLYGNCQKRPTAVRIFVYVKYLTLDYTESLLTIQSWLSMNWKDERVEWSPEKYGGLDEATVDSMYIWIPSLMEMNAVSAADTDMSIREFRTPCIIRNNGDVSCVPRISHQVLCHSVLTDWPYDKLNCTMVIGPYFNSSTGPNITFVSFKNRYGGVSVTDAYIVDGWVVKGLDYGNKTKNQLFVTLSLERRAQDLEVIILTPILITVTFLIVSLFLNVDNNLRMLIICFCMYLHTEVIGNITYMMPKHSSSIPKILTFLRISVGINCVLMIISLILGRVVSKEYPAPIWLGAMNNLILETKAKYILLTRWRPILNEDDNKFKFAKEWVDFANILNAIFGLIVLTVYLCIVIVFIPWPQTVEGLTKDLDWP